MDWLNLCDKSGLNLAQPTNSGVLLVPHDAIVRLPTLSYLMSGLVAES